MLGAWLIAAATSCKAGVDEKAEIRREVLRAENLAAERSQRIATHRITDADGALLPSNTKVAGVVLPRGFSPKFTFDHEWYYDGELPFRRVETYFEEQLDATVERPDNYAVLFNGAKTKGADQMQRVAVKVFPVPGRSGWTRIYIHEAKPLPEHMPTREEVEAELARRAARE